MSTAAFDFVAGFFHVVRTSISARTKSTLLDLVGVPDPTAPDDNSKGEQATAQLNYGPLGLLSNPLDEGQLPDGTPAWAENIALRTADGVIPIAWNDPRISAAFKQNGLAKGSIALAGYAGAFHSIDLTNAGTSNIHVLYAPLPASDELKAHAIILDTTSGNESVSGIHAFGQGWFLAPDGSIQLKSANGSASLQIVDGKISLFGNTVIAGGVLLGDPNAAEFLAKFPELGAYLSALEGALTTAFGAITGPGGGPAVLTSWGGFTGPISPGLRAAIPTTLTKGA